MGRDSEFSMAARGWLEVAGQRRNEQAQAENIKEFDFLFLITSIHL